MRVEPPSPSRPLPVTVIRALSLLLRLLLVGLPWILAEGCASSVNDCLAEMQYGDPDSVRAATIEVGELISQKELAGYPLDEGDREAIALLRDLAGKNHDSILRACAVSSLGRLTSPDSMDVFLQALQDNSTMWVVRLEAAKAIAAHPAPTAAGPLVKQMEDEQRLEVRLEILKALRAVGGMESLKILLKVFLDNSTRFRNMKLATYEAICALSGKTFALEDSASWKKYYDELSTSGKSG